MAKAKKKTTRGGKARPSNLAVFVIVLLAVGIGAVTWLFVDLSQKVSQYKTVESLPNQACVGLSVASQNGFTVPTDGLSASFSTQNAESPLAYKCTIGLVAEKTEIHSRLVSEYALGASVTYFESNEAAKEYAAKKLEPQRYWSVPNPKKIVHSFIASSVINDNKGLDLNTSTYFDSYAVKDNAVVRLSLPCRNINSNLSNSDFDRCDKDSLRAIQQFADKVVKFQF